jgi:hypothetical protein
MRSIARLLFGPDGDRLLDLLEPESGERRMTARVREAGEWCQTTPGAGPAHRTAPPRAGRLAADPRRRRG